MTATREERAYRNSGKKCAKSEATSILLEELISRKLGTREVEEFLIAESLKNGGKKFISKIQKHKEERAIIEQIMKNKKRENMRKCIYLRKCRNEAKLALKTSLGGENRQFKRIVKEVRENCKKIKENLRKKNTR